MTSAAVWVEVASVAECRVTLRQHARGTLGAVHRLTQGVLSNTLVKLAMALTVARGHVRWHASLVLALMAVLLGLALVVS